MAERKSVPDIRFAGFGGGWERRKLGDTFDFLHNNTLSRAELSLDHGEARNVHYGDILVKFGEYLDVSKTPLPFISDRHIVDKFKALLLQDGDVIMADTAEDEAVGKCLEVAGVRGVPVISGLHTIPMRPTESFAAGYLGYYLNSDAYRNQLLPLMQGIKVMSVSKSAIQDTDVSFPMDMAEQAAIGRYFIQLDGCIMSLQHKLTVLVNFKNAMLHKMFPKDGATVPEIRFNGFSGDWEQRKLGQLCAEFNSGDFIKAEDIVDTGVYPVFGGNGMRGYADRYNHDGDYALIGRQGALCGNMNYSSGKAYFTEHAVAIKANNFNDTKFLYYCFGVMNLVQYSGQSAQPGLAVGNLVELETMIPRKAEQERISHILTAIDSLITLHQRKLDCLRNIKEACLEKMFV